MIDQDVIIGVLNEGPYPLAMTYDNKEYEFPIKKLVPLPYHVANWMFGIEIDEAGKLYRPTLEDKDGNEATWPFRMSGMVPKRFYPTKDAEGNNMIDSNGRLMGAYGDDKQVLDFLQNKIKFFKKKMPKVMTLEDFQ